jgi:hypothetical protein
MEIILSDTLTFLFMKTYNPIGKAVKWRSLIKMHEKNYFEAIRNNVEFDKIKIIQQTIKQLKKFLSKEGK